MSCAICHPDMLAKARLLLLVVNNVSCMQNISEDASRYCWTAMQRLLTVLLYADDIFYSKLIGCLKRLVCTGKSHDSMQRHRVTQLVDWQSHSSTTKLHKWSHLTDQVAAAQH